VSTSHKPEIFVAVERPADLPSEEFGARLEARLGGEPALDRR
jgi:hypothetical protein